MRTERVLVGRTEGKMILKGILKKLDDVWTAFTRLRTEESSEIL
jgi:hypothetical protein